MRKRDRSEDRGIGVEETVLVALDADIFGSFIVVGLLSEQFMFFFVLLSWFLSQGNYLPLYYR